MSAETLRRAAELMRERAAAATGGPWENNDLAGPTVMAAYGSPADGASIAGANHWDDAEHIASWHPAVALAVAKAIDDVADAWEICDDGWTRDMDDDAIRFEDTVDGGWLAVARAYLGESA